MKCPSRRRCNRLNQTFGLARDFDKDDCAVCHGLPRAGFQGAIALGEFPKPPHLLRGMGVTGTTSPVRPIGRSRTGFVLRACGIFEIPFDRSNVAGVAAAGQCEQASSSGERCVNSCSPCSATNASQAVKGAAHDESLTTGRPAV